jgi:hypothetical protein
MTPEEINALLETLIDSFRAFVAEEVEKYYGMGKRISSQEFYNLLKAFEANEMTKMFNSEWIPQDKFRVFLRSYLRAWFDWLIAKIEDVGEDVTVADSLDDLPDDGSSIIAVVNGVLYYWDGSGWAEACNWKIPVYSGTGELPPDGGRNIGIVTNADMSGGYSADLYYYDPALVRWVKAVTEQELADAISVITDSIGDIYDNISNYVNNVLESNSFKDKGKTYHDAVLEIVDTIPAMSEGDRYLLVVDASETPGLPPPPPQQVKEIETLHSALVSKGTVPYNTRIWREGDITLVGEYILYGNTATSAGQVMDGHVKFGGSVYCVGLDDSQIYRFNYSTKSYESIVSEHGEGAGLIPFDGKLWFTSGTGNEVSLSYIDAGGQVHPGTPFTVSGKGGALNFKISAAVYQNKLHIIGTSGLWTLEQGTTVPVHVDSAIFDSTTGTGGSAVVFDGKLWVDTNNGKIIAYNGAVSTEYSVSDVGSIFVWDGELFCQGQTYIRKLNGDTFEIFKNIVNYNTGIADGLLWGWIAVGNGPLCFQTVDKSGNVAAVFSGLGGILIAPDGSLIVVKVSTGQIIVERHYYKTIGGGGDGGGGGELTEIKIVGRDANGQYDEPFEEGHRVVVKNSPTGYSREYSIRDGTLIDADGSDNSAIRGNVDTYADLSAIDTTLWKVGDGIIVEHDGNHDGNSAIYTWDGSAWNFTHLWEISMHLKYGTYTVADAAFTFNRFAAKNENSEEFDVLEVSFDGPSTSYSVSITSSLSNAGDTGIMIFNVPVNKTATLSFGFPHRLVDGGELTLTPGMHAVSLIRSSVSIINIAPYE